MRRKALVAIALGAVFLAGLAAALRPAIATGHTGGASIDCQAVGFAYSDFANATNVVSESITVDGSAVYGASFSFAGPSGGHSVAISPGAGTHAVVASASWDTNGHVGSFQTSATVECGGGTTTTTTTSTPPCIPRNPDGSPGGKDGKPGNDDCAADETPKVSTPPPSPSTTPTAPPITTVTTTPSAPAVTTTTSQTPAPPKAQPSGPKPHHPTGRKPPRRGTPSPPPVCPVATTHVGRCAVQGSG